MATVTFYLDNELLLPSLKSMTVEALANYIAALCTGLEEDSDDISVSVSE